MEAGPRDHLLRHLQHRAQRVQLVGADQGQVAGLPLLVVLHDVPHARVGRRRVPAAVAGHQAQVGRTHVSAGVGLQAAHHPDGHLLVHDERAQQREPLARVAVPEPGHQGDDAYAHHVLLLPLRRQILLSSDGLRRVLPLRRLHSVRLVQGCERCRRGRDKSARGRAHVRRRASSGVDQARARHDADRRPFERQAAQARTNRGPLLRLRARLRMHAHNMGVPRRAPGEPRLPVRPGDARDWNRHHRPRLHARLPLQHVQLLLHQAHDGAHVHRRRLRCESAPHPCVGRASGCERPGELEWRGHRRRCYHRVLVP